MHDTTQKLDNDEKDEKPLSRKVNSLFEYTFNLYTR